MQIVSAFHFPEVLICDSLSKKLFLHFVCIFGRFGFELLFAVVAAESDFFTFVRDGYVSTHWAGAHWTSFVDGRRRSDSGYGKSESKGEKQLFHDRY